MKLNESESLTFIAMELPEPRGENVPDFRPWSEIAARFGTRPKSAETQGLARGIQIHTSNRFYLERGFHPGTNYRIQNDLISHFRRPDVAADIPPAPISKLMPCITVPFSFDMFKSTMNR